MLYQGLAYIKFLAASKNQHGVHSPFVFDLVTNCIYDKRPYPDYEKLKDFREQLLSDSTVLEIEDLGSGSKTRSSSSATVKSIAKSAGSRLSQTKLLYRICRYFQPQTILELGTSLGLGTQAFALAAPHSQIYTLEGSPAVSKYASDWFMDMTLNHIISIHGSFEKTLSLPPVNHWDMVFMDGHHNYEATIGYFEMLLPNLHNDSMVILDDIYWSASMERAWRHIKNHEKVTAMSYTYGNTNTTDKGLPSRPFLFV